MAMAGELLTIKAIARITKHSEHVKLELAGRQHAPRDRRRREGGRGRSGTGLVVPPNITIMALPPKCPELNPVENVWQFLRDNWLSNRVFKSYDDLVDHCCVAWNKLVNQPWRIMSIGLRQWAYRF
jgi:transposase